MRSSGVGGKGLCKLEDDLPLKAGEGNLGGITLSIPIKLVVNSCRRRGRTGCGEEYIVMKKNLCSHEKQDNERRFRPPAE